MKKKNSFYITTAIDYPSGKPHIGHAYEKILADVIARWQRRKGKEVFFLTGTDEHGQKIEKYAKAQQKPPQEFVDAMSAQFIELCRSLNISNDDFIRTTQPRHVEVAERYF
jgi:methionyl-tRNA synthetase (EC 6.1.1.10)